MVNRRFLLSLVLVVTIFGCENEPPESIGEIQCSIDSDNNFAYNGALVLTRGYVHLDGVEVSGNKNNNPKVASTSFQSPEQFFFIGDDPRQPIKVPVAEGIYNNSKVQLNFFRDPYQLQLRDTTFNSPSDDGNNSDENDGDDDDNDGDDDENDGDDDDDGDDNDGDDDDGRISTTGRTVNLEDFVNNAKPSIVLLGSCSLKRKNVKVLVALDYNVLQLSPVSGQDSLIVRRSSRMSAIVTFQPGLLFSSITEAELEKAILLHFRGETVLFIHKEFNQNLHDAIASRISQTSKLVFSISNEL